MLPARNILIFHQGALGDFIVTWPLALALSRTFAQSRVFYIASAQKGALAQRVLGVESFDVELGWHQLFSGSPELPQKWQRLLLGAQWVISFVSDGSDQWAHNVRSLAPESKLVCLSTIPPQGFSGHVTGFLLEQLASWPILQSSMTQMLQWINHHGIGRRAAVDGPIVVHPGAGSARKCWPAASFMQLCHELKSRGAAVTVILGEVELEKWPAEQIRRLEQAANLVKPESLIGLFNVIDSAGAFVGNDSGPGHLAGILGLPTISLFGPKAASCWKPLGPRVQVIDGPWDQITPRMVCQRLLDPAFNE